MNVSAIPRRAVDGYLKLVRVPFDGAIRLLPGNGTGAKPAAGIALDRVDARARTVFAKALRDPALAEDAARRREAANQREHALRLRSQADVKGEQADTRFEERHEQAARQREQAKERAKRRRQQAARQEKEKKSRAAQIAANRATASHKTAQRREEALGDQATRERLQTLDAKSDALAEQQKELTARDEARRLSEAASRAKAERKDG
jgi:hypothetical protein